MTRWVLILTALFATSANGLHADDWPQFLGVQRDGVSRETGLKLAWPNTGPTAVWQRDVGAGFSGVAVSQRKAVLFHRVGDQEVVESLDAGTGQPIWQFRYETQFDDAFGKGNGPRSSPTIAGKRVVTFGADGWLHVVDFETGKKVWGRNVVNEYKTPPSYFGVGSSPLVVDGLVLVNVGAKKAGIVAFDLETGAEAWKATDDGASYASPILTSATGSKQAIFFTREGVVILEPKTGALQHRQRWRARYDASVNAATPLVIGKQVFISASYETGGLALQLKPQGAEEIWQAENIMSNHYNTCVVHDGHLYGFEGRQEAGPSLRCVEWSSKKVMWDRPGFGCGSMVLVDGALVILTERGELISASASPKEYRELSRAKVFAAGPCRAQLALADGRLYARDAKRLVCFDLRNQR